MQAKNLNINLTIKIEIKINNARNCPNGKTHGMMRAKKNRL